MYLQKVTSRKSCVKNYFFADILKVNPGSGSGSISQRHGSADPDPDPHQNVMFPDTGSMVPVPVAQHWPVGVLSCPALLNGLPGEALQQPEENARLHAYQGAGHSRTQHA